MGRDGRMALMCAWVVACMAVAGCERSEDGAGKADKGKVKDSSVQPSESEIGEAIEYLREMRTGLTDSPDALKHIDDAIVCLESNEPFRAPVILSCVVYEHAAGDASLVVEFLTDKHPLRGIAVRTTDRASGQQLKENEYPVFGKQIGLREKRLIGMISVRVVVGKNVETKDEEAWRLYEAGTWTQTSKSPYPPIMLGRQDGVDVWVCLVRVDDVRSDWVPAKWDADSTKAPDESRSDWRKAWAERMRRRAGGNDGAKE